jgi:DNA-binding response OmpR family regulator
MRTAPFDAPPCASPAGILSWAIAIAQSGATDPAHEPLRTRATRPTARRILLIEDSDSLRAVLTRTLELAGYHVTGEASGDAGLRSFRAAPADLVITDIVMSGHEGIAVIIQLRDAYPDTPIIAISGCARAPHYLDVALKLGASRSLAKPFTQETLLAAVRETLATIAP